ncbi:MAG TPA: hypothetical protein VK550_30075 [Polyangiaceae bacterium]|nr:hypothetical protein [Polyangiaceae bacterium]
MAPDAMSASARARLIFDQGLFAVHGEKRWSQADASSARFWLSIQPHESAASSARAYVVVADRQAMRG